MHRDTGMLSFVLVTVTGAALAVRATAVVPADFPLNDGGLFLAMIAELERNGWMLPASVTWNGIEVPFAYPPLGLYLTGAAASLSGVGIEILMQVLPAAFSAIAAALVLGLGRQLLGSLPGATAAALTYAFAPAAFTWSVAGGGVTRAPGIVLALTTIWLLRRMLDRPETGRGLLVGVAAGATALTHPAAAAFAALSSLLLVLWALFRSRHSPSGIVPTAAVALATAVLIVLPWVALITLRHGLSAFTDVPSNGPDPLIALMTLGAGRVTGSGTDPLAVLILGTAILSVVRRRFLLPAWLVASAFIGLQYAIVPASLLAGSLFADAIVLVRSTDTRRRATGRAAAAVIAMLLALEASFGFTASSAETSHLHPLGPERRAAMQWLSENTAESATAAVLTGDRWSTDPDSEWFYVLAERPSVATVQGHEWLGRTEFERAAGEYAALQRCTASVSCLDAWLLDTRAEYVFIPKGRRHGPHSPADCCAGVRAELRQDAGYDVAYDGPGATIVRVQPPRGAAP